MRQQLITIPLLNVLVQWIKDRLNEKSNTNHTHAEYLSELPAHTHEEYLTVSDLPAPVDLSEYPTRFEVQTVVQSVADPVIVLTEAEFAAIVPDVTKIYVIY